jgi:glucoamylase
VVATQELGPGRDGSVTLALGFGRSQAQAAATAQDALLQPFGSKEGKYLGGWARYDAGLRRPPAHFPGEPGSATPRLDDAYDRSANVIKASEDKTFRGAIVASLASPWGQAVPAGLETGGEPAYFGSYREVFARDLYEAFTGLLADGDLATARAAALFLLDRRQLPDGSLPRNSLLNGQAAPDTGALQLDDQFQGVSGRMRSGIA